MKVENRRPAEGINATDENPLKELAWLLAGSLAVVVALVFAVSLMAQWIAPRIPYRYEARLAESLPTFATTPASKSGQAIQSELQALADRLVMRMELPDGMTVRVGYRDEPVINAFATIGGQTVFFRGLLERIGSEDELAMVMAHEIAHLKLRHAAAALGRGVAAGVILSMVSVDLGRNAAGSVLGHAGLLTTFSFNRNQEREADEVALRTLVAEYGHLGGAIDLFGAMTHWQQRAAARPSVELLQTHPLTASRLAAIDTWARANAAPLDGPRRPLPPAIAKLPRISTDLRPQPAR